MNLLYLRIMCLLVVLGVSIGASKAGIESNRDRTTFLGDLITDSNVEIVNGSLLFNGNGNLISLVSNINNLALDSNLTISDQVRIRGGDPANGRILISDANGLGVWGDPAAAPGGGDFSNFGDQAFADRSFGNVDSFAMDLLTNGVSRVNISASGIVTFNPNSQNADFVVQGLNSSALISVDADADSVGFGLDDPEAKLQVNGSMLLGSSSGPNLSFDENGIQARDNANAATLFLQEHSGGRVRVGTTSGAGTIGVGTTNPTASADIDGLLRVRGGNPVAGATLVSDANGVGTWQTIAFQGDQGEQGDRGPQGFPGIQGETGPQGNKGPQGVEGPVASGCTTVARSQTFNGNLTVTCPAGTIRTAGGVRCNSPPGGRYIIDRSEPIGFDSWRGRCELMDGSGSLVNIEVRAHCCRI